MTKHPEQCCWAENYHAEFGINDCRDRPDTTADPSQQSTPSASIRDLAGELLDRTANPDDDRYQEAVDWMLDRMLAADPDLHAAFWAYVEGRIDRAQLDAS